jgi:hypothetical protein
VYVLAGGLERADFVQNLRADPRVTVLLGGEEGEGAARVLTAGTDEDRLARRLLLEKYKRPGHADLDDFARSALAVAVDLNPARGPTSP